MEGINPIQVNLRFEQFVDIRANLTDKYINTLFLCRIYYAIMAMYPY